MGKPDAGAAGGGYASSTSEKPRHEHSLRDGVRVLWKRPTRSGALERVKVPRSCQPEVGTVSEVALFQ